VALAWLLALRLGAICRLIGVFKRLGLNLGDVQIVYFAFSKRQNLPSADGTQTKHTTNTQMNKHQAQTIPFKRRGVQHLGVQLHALRGRIQQVKEKGGAQL
jgi:hypothetical protein